MSKAATATARGRIGTPVEVAQAALFPASDAASFGNGAHLFVEKGFTAGGGAEVTSSTFFKID
jgi:NAD(P)-dependent dehydrogenase (short-subunit alcohol dehydrogenase family)